VQPETTAEVIKHFNPQGLKGATYFVYRGIKVSEKGKSEKIQKDIDTPYHMRFGGDLHPGTVE